MSIPVSPLGGDDHQIKSTIMRSRNIKPGAPKNDVLAELPFETRLLFVWLPMLADWQGKLEDRPKRIKAELFPYDDVDINHMLDVLEAKAFITRYVHESLAIIKIINFEKHQHPHPDEKKKPSIFPNSKDNSSRSVHEAYTKRDRNLTNESIGLIPDSLNLIPDSCNPHTDSRECESSNVQNQDIEKTFVETETSDEFPEAIKLSNLAVKEYKNTQYANEVLPHVINLLGYVSADVLEKAILNASKAGSKNHKYRPNFAKRFLNEKVVREIAESPVRRQDSSESDTVEDIMNYINEQERLEQE